jgi:hypothetical protein
MNDANASALLNLDLLAARHAQQIAARTGDVKASDVDNMVTKALGVLQENGLYACALFLLARKKKEKHARTILDEFLDLLQEMGWGDKPDATQSKAVLDYLTSSRLEDLSATLLAKETAEQMLIYARYGAKARSADSQAGGADKEE